MAVRLGVIAGREAYQLMRLGVLRSERRFAMRTPFGEAQPVYLMETQGQSYYFLPRQGEGDSRVAPSAVNYRANVYALKELGVQAILAWSGPAALAAELPVGALVLPDDVIDLTRRREQTFFDRSRLGIIRSNPVFCPTLRRVCAEALASAGLAVVSTGTYVCAEGPRLETPAEARLFASWGAALVGMTLCPEVFLARELAMCYAALCHVTGHGEGLGERRRAVGALYAGLADGGELLPVEMAAARFPQVIAALLRRLAQEPEDWPCRRELLADRDAALQVGDWHEWLRSP